MNLQNSSESMPLCLGRKPRITVLMPVYNTPVDILKKAIDSILNQSFDDFCFMILDDGSDKRDVLRCLDEYEKKDKRITLVKNEENIGLIRTLNKGLKLSNTKWVARMDSDDIADVDRLKWQMRYVESNDSLCVLAGEARYLENGRLFPKKNQVLSNDQIVACMPFYCPICHPSVVMDREKILSIGGYPDVKGAEDYALWTKIIFETTMVIEVVPKVLIRYRKGGKNRKSQNMGAVFVYDYISDKLNTNSLSDILLTKDRHVFLKLLNRYVHSLENRFLWMDFLFLMRNKLAIERQWSKQKDLIMYIKTSVFCAVLDALLKARYLRDKLCFHMSK